MSSLRYPCCSSLKYILLSIQAMAMDKLEALKMRKKAQKEAEEVLDYLRIPPCVWIPYVSPCC